MNEYSTCAGQDYLNAVCLSVLIESTAYPKSVPSSEIFIRIEKLALSCVGQSGAHLPEPVSGG